MKYKLKSIWIRSMSWEYWPFALVYGPIIPFYLWYSIRARSFFFFSASNPTIQNGGFLMESKYAIDTIIPSKYRPPSVFFKPGVPFEEIVLQINAQEFGLPLIVKPDIGGKGVGVHKVDSIIALKEVVSIFTVPFIIQPFIELPNEIGLFYINIPGSGKPFITGIVEKQFLIITGDGKHTILELLEMNPRYLLQIPTLMKHYRQDIHRILPDKVQELLVPFGNHARGSLFIDRAELISPLLVSTFSKICNEIDGFNFGRLDIRYKTWEELERGENFSIIELNGAGSEPTHIYDPKHSLLFAWKEIIRHWKLLWMVSIANRKLMNLKFMNLKTGVKLLMDTRKYDNECRRTFN